MSCICLYSCVCVCVCVCVQIQKADGAEKGRLKAELASELQQGWKRQVGA